MTDADKGVLRAPRGMRDFYPDEMAVQNAIFSAWQTAASRYGFVQYDACVVESLDLLKRKAGEEIEKQIYAFKDKSGRDLALRPEMTPTLARMIAVRQGSLSFPLKWFAIAQCFRYERTTRGRKREHYQWNLDIVDEPSVSAEAEVIATAVFALSLLGIGPDDAAIHVSSRSLLADLFDRSGIPRKTLASVFLALDKLGKLTDEDVSNSLLAAGLSKEHVEAAFRIMRLSGLEEARDLLGEETDSCRELVSLFSALSSYGIGEMARFDISVVRGLGYYTGIVFEAFDAKKQHRAIFGGGRYDDLLQDIGGRPMSGVGLGFGDVVIAELLSASGKLAGISPTRDLALGFMQEEQRPAALGAAQELRRRGKNVDLVLRSQKPKAFFSWANKNGFAEAAFIGPDEVLAGEFRIKMLADGTERGVVLTGC